MQRSPVSQLLNMMKLCCKTNPFIPSCLNSDDLRGNEEPESKIKELLRLSDCLAPSIFCWTDVWVLNPQKRNGLPMVIYTFSYTVSYS